jgi:hypothetical protein
MIDYNCINIPNWSNIPLNNSNIVTRVKSNRSVGFKKKYKINIKFNRIVKAMTERMSRQNSILSFIITSLQ